MAYERILNRLLEYGVLAPSMYNSQPWRFSVNPKVGELEIFADEKRTRPAVLDPAKRDLFLALGACLDHMVLAASALGYELKETLFPEPSQPLLAAKLVLKPLPETMPESLFSTLLTRQTHSGKFKEGSVQGLHLERLKKALIPSPDHKIYFLTEDNARQKLAQFLHDLSHEGSQDKALVEEGARWITPLPEPQEGISMDSIGLPISVKARFALLRYFGVKREIREVARQTLLRQGHGIEAPAYLLMTTMDFNPNFFLQAGRQWARLALTLSELELGSQSLHLPLSLASGREGLGGFFQTGKGEEPVLLVRFGQPEIKTCPKTSRRPAEQCVFPGNFH